ncbi:MAG: restriction endonuclease subunit S [Candidatus Gracilibacteria bacterium]
MTQSPTTSLKQSNIPWIGEIPEDWEVRRLKFLARIQTGDKDTQDNLPDGIYPFFVRSENIESLDSYSMDCEAVLTAGDGVGAGRVFHYFQGKFAFHQRVYAFTDFRKVTGKYLYYFMKSNFYNEVLRISAKSTVDSLRLPMLQNFQIPLPPLSTQTAIANFLDQKTTEIKKLVENKRKLIELLKEQKQSIIHRAVTKGIDPNAKMKESGIPWIGEIPEDWEVRRLKMLSNIKRGASPRPIDDKKYFDDNGEFAWVRISDVSASNMYLETTEQQLSELGASLSVKQYPGDLFLSIAGSVGKPIIANIKCCIHDGFVTFGKLNERINKMYLFYILYSGLAYSGIGKEGTQLNLNIDTVGNIVIPLPNNFTQNKIIQYIEQQLSQIDSAIAKIEQEIALIEEYQTSLIYQTVTGKISIS